jgi:putative peptidoglycan lipid II flippase
MPHDPGLRAMLRLLVPAGLSAGVTYATGIAEIAAASLAAEPNAVPMVVNSWLLVGLPVRLIGAAAGQAVFPRLAMAANASDWQHYRARFWRTIAVVALLTAPAIPAFWLLGDRVTHMLFARGAYTAADAELTARLAFAFALGLPFYAVSEVATRALVAVRDARSPLLVNIVQSGVRIAMMLALVDAAGVMVIAWSLAITASLECLAMLAILSRRLRWRRADVV